MGRIAFILPQLFTVVLMIVSFGLGVYTVYLSPLGAPSIGQPLGAIPIFFLGLGQSISLGTSVGLVFAVLFALYAILVGVAIVGPRQTLFRTVSSVLRHGVDSALGNTMMFVASVFPALSLILIAIEKLQDIAGIPTGNLVEMDPMMTFATVSIAPITEEIGFRMTVIGLLASAILTRRPNLMQTLRVLWHPSKALDADGTSVDSQRRKILIAIVVFSSLTFGLAHVAFKTDSGEGWQIGKVTTSSLAGIALGYTYIYYGITGAILLHWSFNYFISAYHYFDCSVIPEAGSCIGLNSGLTGSFLENYILAAGTITLVITCTWILMRFTSVGRSAKLLRQSKKNFSEHPLSNILQSY
ncbi:MAG: CPBP family intramembrane metalloprotease [Thaumarchaeota archaeon]|nr:CPBP family intramembrane metalloprotease [Nitrososphaerota archaeon]